ncbi:hypothetical protein [Nafulsella turpanensis]|uniref:hypothetical protein n=1 Tax=Nafulsella turpanensis TaxID=1265690 RepID=UPI0003475637|nr:hypothetical protein [Nafulsella turpanensis]
MKKNRTVKMVKTFVMVIVLALFGFNNAVAQDGTEITDDKLEAYIMVMDSVTVLKTQLSDTVSAMIVEHELMDGGRAYNIIKSAAGDSVQLAEEGITDEQLVAFKELQKKREELEAALNESFSNLVKEYVGISEYNTIRKGLKNDPELKERYQALKESDTAEAATTESGTPE